MSAGSIGDKETSTASSGGCSRRVSAARVLSAVLLVVLVVLNFQAAVVFALFLLAVVLKVNRIIPLAVSLVLLLLCALMNAVHWHMTAKNLAEWAFHFLAIGVTLTFYDYLKAGRGGSEAADR